MEGRTAFPVKTRGSVDNGPTLNAMQSCAAFGPGAFPGEVDYGRACGGGGGGGQAAGGDDGAARGPEGGRGAGRGEGDGDLSHRCLHAVGRRPGGGVPGDPRPRGRRGGGRDRAGGQVAEAGERKSTRVGKECVSTCRSRWWPSH